MRGSRDTSAAAAERQLANLRQMTAAERLDAAAAMTADVRALAEAGIRSRHPEFSPEQVKSAVNAILLARDRETSKPPNHGG